MAKVYRSSMLANQCVESLDQVREMAIALATVTKDVRDIVGFYEKAQNDPSELLRGVNGDAVVMRLVNSEKAALVEADEALAQAMARVTEARAHLAVAHGSMSKLLKLREEAK
jgi:hypothetical protein